MLTVFERIPDYFIERYNDEMEAWGRNFQAIGPVKSIVLREGRLSDVSPDEEAGAVLRQVKLRAEVSRNGFTTENATVTVRPASEEDERKIANHCQKMQEAGWASRLYDKEPARPWIPFMPSIDKQRPN